MTGHMVGDARKRDQEVDVEDEIDDLMDVLVEYDERGDLFGTSGAGAFFLAEFLVKAGYRKVADE